MSRAIDADPLLELYADRLEKLEERYGAHSSECGVLSGAMKLLEIQPTIEARKKGRWVMTPDGMLTCSNCLENPTNRIIINGNLVYDMTPIRKRMRFCPNCGADMREEGEAE